MLFRILIGVLIFERFVGGVFETHAQVKILVDAGQTQPRSSSQTQPRSSSQTQVRSATQTQARSATQTQARSAAQTLASKTISDPKTSVYTHKAADPDGVGKVYMGREIAKVMGFDGADWLERDYRQKEEKTLQAIQKLPITKNSIVADIGAGTGYYTFKIAPKLTAGKIYAEEIQDEMLHYLANRKNQLGLKNVEIVRGTAKSTGLVRSSVDVVLLVDVYHELLYPNEMLASVRESLKPCGKVVILEYRAEDKEVPIRNLHKMSALQVNKEFSVNGFKLISDQEFLPWQHFLVFQRVETGGR